MHPPAWGRTKVTSIILSIIYLFYTRVGVQNIEGSHVRLVLSRGSIKPVGLRKPTGEFLKLPIGLVVPSECSLSMICMGCYQPMFDWTVPYSACILVLPQT